MNSKQRTGATSVRAQRKADEKRFGQILKSTEFDVSTLQQLEQQFLKILQQHEKANEFRPNDQQAVDAIEAIGFRDYCLGLHGVIEEGEPQQKLKLLMRLYAQEEDEITRKDVMRMLKEHTAASFHAELDGSVYTWMKMKFHKSTSVQGDSMKVEDALLTILQHPNMLYDKIEISIENLIRCMNENNRRDQVILNSLKHL